MESDDERSGSGSRLRKIFIGAARSPQDKTLYHKLSLVAFFAWVALGADGLSSSSYGPEEAFLALQNHTYLGIFVALGSALTVIVISASYSQIIELFPTGGGGYLVASKLLSPTVGMVSGCALLIDYVLTITISIASGADALFSFLPQALQPLKIEFAIAGVVLLMLLNLRGVKESVIPLVPIFLIFVGTHVALVGYGVITHLVNLPEVAGAIRVDIHKSREEIGMIGMIFLILKAYSMGAGTFTGIEAVSNGLPILREPKVATAHRTMRYMAISLATLVVGLMALYLLFEVQPQAGKTLNAVLFEKMTAGWGSQWGYYLVLVTLISEAALLFIAAQTGFLDGPRVLSNMALDRWFPTRFATLSDRLVTQNGILIMGIAALTMMIFSRGSVRFLVVLYSINVFITFVLSQLGMVKHWWISRKKAGYWLHKFLINGVGLAMSTFILVSVVVLKFNEGGWITVLVTGALVVLVLGIRRHYQKTTKLLGRLDALVQVVESPDAVISPEDIKNPKPQRSLDPRGKTAVIMVNGFNGLGLHTLFSVIRLFGDVYKNYVFVEIGAVDAGNFKGIEEIQHLEDKLKSDLDRYVQYMRRNGYYAEGFSAIGIDVVDEIAKLAPKIQERFHNAIFFGGQLVFGDDFFFSRWLHNYTVFAIQKRFYRQATPVVILPIRVY